MKSAASASHTVLVVPLRLIQCGLWRQGLRFNKRMLGQLQQADPVARDIGEEVSAARQLRVHVRESVDDEVDRGAQALSGGELRQQAPLGAVPELQDVGQFLVADNDEQVIVREVATHRILDPVAAGVGAEEHNLEDLTVLDAPGLAPGDRLGEGVGQNLDDEG